MTRFEQGKGNLRATHQLAVTWAALRMIETRRSDRFTILDFPDERERTIPAVDLIVEGSSVVYAIEHTVVESFLGRLKDDHHFSEFAETMQRELSEGLPTPGHLRLVVDPLSLEGTKQIYQIRGQLAEWVREHGPSLEIGTSMTAPRHVVVGRPNGIPFDVRLERWQGRDGELSVYRSTPEDLEDRRRLRIRKALEDKCPKLQEAKGTDKRSLLVLESSDQALGNYADIAASVAAELKETALDLPDDICLVETEFADQFCVWMLKEGAEIYEKVLSAGPHYIQIEPGADRHRPPR